MENPEMDYLEKEKWVLPGPLGAHNWQAMSVDVDAGLVYLPAQDNPLIYGMAEEWKQTGLYKRNPGSMNLGIAFGTLVQLFVNNVATQPTPKGYLKAFDPLRSPLMLFWLSCGMPTSEDVRGKMDSI